MQRYCVHVGMSPHMHVRVRARVGVHGRARVCVRVSVCMGVYRYIPTLASKNGHNHHLL
jgi:hypothetical protein